MQIETKVIKIKTKEKDYSIKISHPYFGIISDSVTLPINKMTWYTNVTNKDDTLKELQVNGITSISFKE